MEMLKKYRVPLLFLLEAGMICTAVSGLLVKGVFSWHLKQPELHRMLTELFLLFLILAAILIFFRKPAAKLIGIGVVVIIFTWLHMIFLPVITALCYIAFLCMAGNFVRKIIFRMQLLAGNLADFIFGAASLIVVYCLMSIFGIGSIRNIKIFLMLICLPLGGYTFLRFRMRGKRMRSGLNQGLSVNFTQALCLAGILVFFLLQAGRMNQGIDFDSYWYGVRSEYILNNGGGIYENLGTVGLVYTYSKGLEILTLPLSDLPSYSFVIAFNLASAAVALYVFYKIMIMLVSKTYSMFACLLLSSIPGVMNMGITAKSDLLTLVFQLLILLFLMYYIYEDKVEYLVCSGSAMLLSWTLKPTSMVFSTVLIGMSGIYLLRKKRLKLKGRVRSWLSLLVSVGALFFVWLRTYRVTGVPVTSVFSSVLTKAGFQMRYPFNTKGIKNYSPNLFSEEGIRYVFQRLYGFFLNPSEDRMNHVIIAWGTVLLAFAVLLLLFFPRSEKSLSRSTKELKGYLYTVFLPLAALNFTAMLMLYRPDGNYFMLFYAMVLLMAVIHIFHIRVPFTRRRIACAFIPLLFFNVVISSVSSWSWTLGFSKVKLLHGGYYDHKKEQRARMEDMGNGEIWNLLAADQRTRVIGFGYHPEVLAFPCNIQSYLDVWNWGSKELIHSVSAFKEYMEYAKTDYIYVQGGYVERGSRHSRMLSKLLLDGVLEDLYFEEGNLLCKVNLTGNDRQEGKENYRSFLERYRFYEEEN